MRNTSISRSNLSDEKLALLAELKADADKDDNTPNAYKRPEKGGEKELDFLWQGFKGSREDKSPGIYLLAGFIAGALCVFVLNSVLNAGSNMQSEDFSSASNSRPAFEKKISRKEKQPDDAAKSVKPAVSYEAPADEMPAQDAAPSISRAEETVYTVQSGDSIGTIVQKFYGKYDPDKIKLVMKANNLKRPDRLSVGQELIIPAARQN